jgi:hypothetical protein
MTVTKPPRPASAPILIILGIVIVALLATSAVGIVIHHRSSTTAAVTPAGYQRVVDTADGLSLAVPAGWRVLNLTTGQIGSELQALKSSQPQLAPVLDLALASLRQVSPGVFAVDVATRTTLFSYGVTAGGIRNLGDVHTPDVVASLNGLGAKNIQTMHNHLDVGDALRVSLQLPVGVATVSELVDYMVLRGRVVVIVLASRGTQAPTALMHQIEATLAST